jgi:hypothetical protein
MGWTCSTYGGGQGYKGFWWGNLKGKRPCGRTSRRGEDNIKIEFQELGWGVDLIVLDRKRNGGEML